MWIDRLFSLLVSSFSLEMPYQRASIFSASEERAGKVIGASTLFSCLKFLAAASHVPGISSPAAEELKFFGARMSGRGMIILSSLKSIQIMPFVEKKRRMVQCKGNEFERHVRYSRVLVWEYLIRKSAFGRQQASKRRRSQGLIISAVVAGFSSTCLVNLRFLAEKQQG